MKRSEVPPAGVARATRARLASLGMAIALAAAACAPDQSVAPGAPVLINYTVVQAVPLGPAPFTIPATTPDCPATPAGAACDTMDDSLCRDVDGGHWCSCVPDDPAMTAGTWSCDPFGAVVAVFAVFDRVLDSAPLDPGDATGLPDIATVTSSGAPVPVLTDYSPNGSPDALVLRFYSLRWEGPSLYTAPDAGAFPANSPYTVELNAGKVLAKDGTTPFSGTGALLDGRLSFRTPPFTGSVVPPVSWFDPNIVFLAFSNLVDLDTIVDVVTPHVTATVNGAPVAIGIAPMNEGTLMIIPAEPWPAAATVVVTVDPALAATSLLGEPLTAPVEPLTFMTPMAMP